MSGMKISQAGRRGILADLHQLHESCRIVSELRQLFLYDGIQRKYVSKG
ncbi:MAG: hypothetical protein HFH85_18850 [Lachnospiraceae bacterium]|nr:hypothetical protein [Lachnospiraceae bacterium]